MLILDALDELGSPAFSREIVLYVSAMYGERVDPPTLGALRRTGAGERLFLLLDIIIQPTLALRVINTATAGCFYISPDFMVFDPALNTYRIGEEKSFITHDRISVDPKDLDNTRRQAARLGCALD